PSRTLMAAGRLRATGLAAAAWPHWSFRARVIPLPWAGDQACAADPAMRLRAEQSQVQAVPPVAPNRIKSGRDAERAENEASLAWLAGSSLRPWHRGRRRRARRRQARERRCYRRGAAGAAAVAAVLRAAVSGEEGEPDVALLGRRCREGEHVLAFPDNVLAVGAGDGPE